MKNQWFEDRKDLLFKNLVHSFIESKIFFDELYHRYQKNHTIPYERMDFWIGSDNKKGPLWMLKDNSHKLFRKTDYKISLSEYLFDWTLGSIFHEGMKLKEDVYQLEVYLPTSESIDTSDDGEKIEKILAEYVKVIDTASKNLEAEMECIHHLFSKAGERLKESLVHYAPNGLLARFILENKKLIDIALGKNSSKKIIASLYPQPESIYLVAGTSCYEGGWFTHAIKYFKRSLAISPHNPEAKQWLKEIEKRA